MTSSDHDYLARALELEDVLEWNDDPLRYPYLRQRVRECYQWWGKVTPGTSWATGVRIVGYAVLRPPSAPSVNGGRPLVYRRVLWCKLADRDGTRTGPPAEEAVDPRVIRSRALTPWLFDSHDLDHREQWLRDRRRELGLRPEERAAPGRPVLRFPHPEPDLTAPQPGA